jgi:hypothetical protein
MAVVSLAIMALTAIAMSVIGVVVARHDGVETPLAHIPSLASSALAWGGGFLLAFSASANALRRDRAEGVRHLFVTRTTSIRGYVLARVGGLFALLAAATGGGTLLVSTVALAAAPHPYVTLRTIQSVGASLVYAIAFAAVIAPVALAALGARSRPSGYVFLLLVLVVPEIMMSRLTGPLPSEVTELCALPSALAALRGALLPQSLDLFRFVRALVALVVFVVGATMLVRRDVLVLDVDPEETT